MQPYQEASEAYKRQADAPGNLAKKGAIIAGTLAAGPLVGRALPFLSEFIPLDLMKKGLSKVDPRLGKFLKAAETSGYALEEARDFLKGSMEGKENAKENRNVIQQYSDDLDAFIKQHVQSGRDPLEAGAMAQLDPKYKKIIAKMEQDHKTPFSALLQTAYGGTQNPEQSRKQALGKFNQKIKKPSMREELQQQFSQEYGQGKASLQGQGGSDDDLIAAFQNILKM